MLFDTLTILGVGLLGGSLGLAAKSRGLVRRVVGVGRDAARLREALAAGQLDESTTDLAAGVRIADLVVVCTPVDLIPQQVRELAEVAKAGCLVTDVGSTKSEIVARLRDPLPNRVTFIGSHPMAGSEKKGSNHATPDLFQGRVTIITPTADTPPRASQAIHEFWERIGCRVVTMTPEEHDRAVALVSHLPHAVAAALAGVVDPALLCVSAGGFRDTTRIASASAAIWEPIFRTNRREVLASCAAFAERFDEFRRLLEAEDGPGLIHWLNEGKRVRDALGS
ncbi:prephenate dehydrogenase [Limnoglobus roseus]|uniref:Prephenate dehydrogenase/arogenate dehydrogenase family protein n=1 Tax=Limnoglobus roseus TaxID=2598579 RepID=A0A5C1AG91_9BACT|nr:prephenate dehydrogenase/arogenate dehydrogenase family protein [Limnoglobus roseus]QEL18231.1 prephenate dehydrogenase/arogenate dehydrogenase family protein [Limnoglobus roseus]